MATPADADEADAEDGDVDGGKTASSRDGREIETTARTEEDRYTRKKVALITGCSSGIGRETARAFLEKDWLVVATAPAGERLDDLAEAGCETMALDVTDPDGVASVVEETVEVGGAIDCLVNNAGYAQLGPLEDVSTHDLHRQFDVNVYGPHRLTRAAVPHMRAQGDGRIVNVSSILGRVAFAGTGPYSGSKFALEAMSDSLRAELEEFGLEVVLVEPGPVGTGFADRVDQELPEKRTGEYESLYEIYDDARLIGGDGPLASDPGDVARAIVEAATCSEPPARYPVGPVAEYGSYARFLPDRIRDALYGLLRKFV